MCPLAVCVQRVRVLAVNKVMAVVAYLVGTLGVRQVMHWVVDGVFGVGWLAESLSDHILLLLLLLATGGPLLASLAFAGSALWKSDLTFR